MQKFRSKKDWWVVAFVICMTGLLIQLLLTMYGRGTMQQYPLHTAVYILTVILIWWPLVNTRYAIDQDQLMIHCMFLKWIIPLQDVENISESNNSVASPALSLDRIKIQYRAAGKSRFILVSPKDKLHFMQALKT